MFDNSKDSWKKPPIFEPYCFSDDRAIQTGLAHMCTQLPKIMLIPLMPAGELHFFVACKRDGSDVNIVQLRINFSGGRVSGVQRRLRLPDAFKDRFQHMQFTSCMMPYRDIALLFWDAFHAESHSMVQRLLTDRPQHAPWQNPGPIFVICTGPQCFTAPNHASQRMYPAERVTELSVVLLEAMASPPAQAFSITVPVDVRDGKRRYLAVIREGGSTRINVVGLMDDGSVFGIIFRNANVLMPNFEVVSVSINPQSRGELIQSVVRAYWTPPTNRIVPVGNSERLFQNDHAFRFNESDHGIQFRLIDHATCFNIAVGLADVCYGGGVDAVMVPVGRASLGIGHHDAFVLVVRGIGAVRNVTVSFAFMDFTRRVTVRVVEIPDSFKAVCRHLTFVTSPALGPVVDKLFWDVLRKVWEKRFEEITVVQRPTLEALGVQFAYTHLPSGNVVPLGSYDCERVEKILRAFELDRAHMRAFMVPLEGEKEYSFVAIVRERSGEIATVFVDEPDQSFRLNAMNPGLFQPPIQFLRARGIAHGDVYDLFEEPITSFWKDWIYKSPHNQRARLIALCMAWHNRLGVGSEMRRLDAELARLTIGEGTVPML
jgi:hypothetical protein